MVNLTQKWAEEYMRMNDKVVIQITGGGSGTGVAALFNGTAQIANISRELKPDEIAVANKKSISPKRFKVALDGIGIIVNKSNPIDSLTIKQIKDIFSGTISNWKALGGNDEEIVLYGRENSSGTYEHFKEIILNIDSLGHSVEFANRTQVLQGTAALGEAVSKDKRGIGYGGIGYFVNRDELKIIKIKATATSKGISLFDGKNINYEIVRNHLYPLSRYLYCFTDGKPNEEVTSFIDFITSPKGQKIVKEMEYIPLPQ